MSCLPTTKRRFTRAIHQTKNETPIKYMKLDKSMADIILSNAIRIGLTVCVDSPTPGDGYHSAIQQLAHPDIIPTMRDTSILQSPTPWWSSYGICWWWWSTSITSLYTHEINHCRQFHLYLPTAIQWLTPYFFQEETWVGNVIYNMCLSTLHWSTIASQCYSYQEWVQCNTQKQKTISTVSGGCICESGVSVSGLYTPQPITIDGWEISRFNT